MIPTWMIEELKRQQRERELEREHPQLTIELPVRWGDEPPADTARSTPVVIDLGGEAVPAPATRIVIDLRGKALEA